MNVTMMIFGMMILMIWTSETVHMENTTIILVMFPIEKKLPK